MKLKKLVSLALSLAIVSSYAVQGFAASEIETAPNLTEVPGSEAPADDSANGGQTGNDPANGGQSNDDPANGGQTNDDPANGGQTNDDQTSNDQANDDQTSNDQANDDQSGNDQTNDDQSGNDQTNDDQSGNDQTNDDQSGNDQTNDDQSGNDQSNDGQTSNDQPNGGQTSNDQPNGGQTSNDQPNGGQTSNDQPNGGQSNDDPANGGQSNNDPANGGQTNNEPANGDSNSWEQGLATFADNVVPYADAPIRPYGYRFYGADSWFSDPVGIRTSSDYYLLKENQPFEDFLKYNQRLRSENTTIRLPKAEIADKVDNVTVFLADDAGGISRHYTFLPTEISEGDMKLISQNLDPTSKLSIEIDDPRIPVTYTALLSGKAADYLQGGGVNLAIRVNTDTKNVLQISLIDPPSTANDNASLEYTINFDDFNQLLDRVGLKNETLTLYGGTYKSGADTTKLPLLTPIVPPGNNALITLTAKNGWSAYYTLWDGTEYITKTQAKNMIDERIAELELVDQKYLQDEIEKLKKEIAAQKYVTEDYVNARIDECFTKDNLDTLVEAVLKKGEFDKLIEDKLKEYFGSDWADLGSYKNILVGYIISQVTNDLKTLNKNLSDLQNLILEAIKGQLGNIFNQNTTADTLEKFILALIALKDSLKGETGAQGPQGVQGEKGDKGDKGDTGATGATGAQGLPGLNGLPGQDGKDGQDFAAWAILNYGSIEGFMNRVSFEGWARTNYGSVDNFIRSISGTNGYSAYELAVQNGYYGSLGQWLESLHGKDGKSAYELAVENGYNGTERQWLDSLQGEDGADGEDGQDGKDGKDGEDGRDGRDGRDGSVVYVNGTYGELPSSVVASGTTQSQVPSAGSVNSDVTLTIDPPASSGSTKGAAANPATGAAVGIFLPAAAAVSVLLVKKGGRRRGRK